MGETKRIRAPGLKWRKLASGHSPVWVADEGDVKAGFRPKTFNLAHLADEPDQLRAQCEVLQAEMLLWRAGHRRDPLAFDGTIRSLLSIYQRHEDSPFHLLKPGSRHPYTVYLGKLEAHVGRRRIEEVSGLDIKRWHRVWSAEGKHLAAAEMSRTVLESALSFGVSARLTGCAELLAVLREARKDRKRMPRRRPRTQKLSADQVTAARAAAHAVGRPSRALAYALAFEAALRLWDVIGQWYPLDWPGMTDIVDSRRQLKWFGLRWEDIDRDMVLRFTPSKTGDTTAASVTYPLRQAPMVLEELRHWPEEQRHGPLIVSEETGLPYDDQVFTVGWNRDRKRARLPSDVWARDLRASGLTEGRAAGASTDDGAKVAGHGSKATTARIYDRANLEAAERFAAARVAARKQSGNSGGNER